MAKRKAIIIYPKLNKCGGDLSKEWYVEWTYRIPGEEKPRRERHYTGLSSGTQKEREKIAKKVIKEKTEWLNSGTYLSGQVTKVYDDQLHYMHEAKQYNNQAAKVITTRTNLSEFLLYKKTSVNKKTYENYVSKLREFNRWLDSKKYSVLHISYINRDKIIEFGQYLSNEKKLSRASIDKYFQIISSFFDFEMGKENIQKNPCFKLPKMGKIIDCSATPFSDDERVRLKQIIKPSDPQLWLSCQIQYYCAIRPGTELRLMKISWIDFDNKQFKIPNTEAKNNLTEIVEIPDFLFEELLEYNIQNYNPDFYLFGKFGIPGPIPFGKNTLRNKFNRYREAAGISEDRKFYSWKHTGAINLINNGAKPFDVMEHLRHKSFDTTEKYLHKRIKMKEKKISKFLSEI